LIDLLLFSGFISYIWLTYMPYLVLSTFIWTSVTCTCGVCTFFMFVCCNQLFSWLIYCYSLGSSLTYCLKF